MSGPLVGTASLVARTRATPLMTGSGARPGYADRLTSPEVLHGTLDGFAAGCRAELNCPARRAGGMSCIAVRTRTAGDWQFAKLCAAGATPAEAAAAIAAADQKPRRTAAARRRTRAPKGDRVTSGGQGRSEALTASHGTIAGYRAGCLAGHDCPSTPTCAEASAAEARGRRTPKPRRRAQHGTRQGYEVLECRDVDDEGQVALTCPAHVAGGDSCHQVYRRYFRTYYRTRRAA